MSKITKSQINQYSIPLGLVGILIVLILPIPTGLLDVLIALNVTVALVIMFVSLYMDKPLEFSSFPTVLLIATMPLHQVFKFTTYTWCHGACS